ncbi:MAG: saccharopine dehydrogenase C-terminal domain-containing protein [Ferruginibacter sp.]
MKTILVFGAGKSATVLIDYLLAEAPAQHWRILIADANRDLILAKTNHSPHAVAVATDITSDEDRSELIQQADIVISMMPPALHILIADDCVAYGKHLLTASYVDDGIRALEQHIREKNLLFICELGLDPGIDHMSAMKLINQIREKGGKLVSFKSHCGGLVAPESDDNPWHYKISWNPRNVVMAGKAGAVYRMNGETVTESYEELFSGNRGVNTEAGFLAYYPNRDSLSYIDLYGMQDARDFLRTTLRYPGFIRGWKAVIDLQLTDETKKYNTDGVSLGAFFKQYLADHDLNNWLQQHPEDAELVIKQLEFLGWKDESTLINKGICSAAEVLQVAMENKLLLHPQDKDMIVMLHELGYELDGQEKQLTSTLIVTGEDALRTAMAKTVGLPLGIAAKLILNGAITLTGLHIPVCKEIYEPVLAELEKQGIRFHETE